MRKRWTTFGGQRGKSSLRGIARLLRIISLKQVDSKIHDFEMKKRGGPKVARPFSDYL